MSRWIENDAQWYEQRMLHCGCCGRLIAKHLLVADDGEQKIFCSEACEQLYRDYAPRRARPRLSAADAACVSCTRSGWSSRAWPLAPASGYGRVRSSAPKWARSEAWAECVDQSLTPLPTSPCGRSTRPEDAFGAQARECVEALGLARVLLSVGGRPANRGDGMAIAAPGIGSAALDLLDRELGVLEGHHDRGPKPRLRLEPFLGDPVVDRAREGSCPAKAAM